MKRILLITLVLAMAIPSGCALFKSSSSGTRIEASHSKPELYGHLHDAENRLGLKHKGGTIRVTFEAGQVRSGDPRWLGRHYDDGVHRGIALGISYSNGKVLLYTTNGAFKPATAVHEMAHQVLFSHGIPAGEHHAIMRAAGIP